MILKIHSVIEGPYQDDDYDERFCYNLCLVETEQGTLEHQEVELESFNAAYEMVKHFTKSIAHLVIDFGDEGN